MLAPETRAALIDVARAFDLDPAALAAVASIESNLVAHAMIDGRAEPLIRFEGHYFDRRLSGAAQAEARAAGLASPTAGAIRNPPSQAARWSMLARARAIDARAADESTSWGMGQVMGAYWAWLGFGSVQALVAEARSGAQGQLRLMARYIEKAGLAAALARRDWPAFARGYNGPGFARNAYDVKLASAHARFARLNWASDEPAGPSRRAWFGARNGRPVRPRHRAGGAHVPVPPQLAADGHRRRRHEGRAGRGPEPARTLAREAAVDPSARVTFAAPLC